MAWRETTSANMNVITPRALVTLLMGKSEDQMVYVAAHDNTGVAICGRVVDVDGDTYDIETMSGETIYDVQIRRIMLVDVRPFQRSTTRSLAEHGSVTS